MTNPTLKPCPFCDGIAENVWEKVPEEEFKYTGLYHEIRCTSCGIKVLRENCINAIKAWNTRAEIKQRRTEQ